MELLIAIGLTLLIFWTVQYFIELNDNILQNYWVYPLTVVFFILILSLWILLTETTYEEIEIQEAVINNTTIQYYMDNGNLIPVPNHATKVIKIKPRTLSFDKVKYEVIYD